jgi:hypothetical protein
MEYTAEDQAISVKSRRAPMLSFDTCVRLYNASLHD